MKITFDHENGLQVTVKPENLNLVENPKGGAALVTKTDQTVLGLLFFPNIHIANLEELKIRIAKAEAAQAQEKKS